MKHSQNVVTKVLFAVVGVGSLFTLTACSQPTSNNTSSPPSAEAPANESASQPTSPTTGEVPTGESSTKTVAEWSQDASNQGSFKTFTQAMQAAGLSDKLTKQGPYTVFAPTDEAFAALPQGTVQKLMQPENKSQLVQLLSYHVVPGQVTSSQLSSGEVATAEGEPVKIKVDSASSDINVNDAKVIQADIPVKNGVVHVVDRVILPAEMKSKLDAGEKTQ